MASATTTAQHRAIAAFVGRPQPSGLTDWWRNQLAKDPTGRHIVLTMDLRIGDRQVLAATERLRTTSGQTGASFDYLPILADEPEVDESYEPGSPSASARSVTVRVPNKFLDAATLVSQGRLLYGVGELSLQVDGGDYDRRWVLLRGVLENASFGRTADSWFEATLRDPNLEVDLPLPPYLVQAGVTFANSHSSAEGQRYPLVINRANDIPGLPVNTLGGNVWYLYTIGIGFNVNAIKVDGVGYVSSHAEYGWQNIETTDLVGLPISVIRFIGTHTWTFGEQVNVTASKTTDPTVLDIVETLLVAYSGLGREGIDLAGIGLALARRAWPVGEQGTQNNYSPYCLVNGGTAETSTGVLSFLEGELLVSWPSLSMAWQRGMYGPVYTEQGDAAVGTLVEGTWPAYDVTGTIQEVTRTGALLLATSFTMRWEYDLIANTFTSSAVRDADNSTLCRVARDAGVGEVAAETIESRFLRSLYEAEAQLVWLARHRTLPAYYVELVCAPEVWFRYRLGDNLDVTLTDLFGGAKVRGTITRKVWRRTAVTLGLHLWWSYTTIGRGVGS